MTDLDRSVYYHQNTDQDPSKRVCRNCEKARRSCSWNTVPPGSARAQLSRRSIGQLASSEGARQASSLTEEGKSHPPKQPSPDAFGYSITMAPPDRSPSHEDRHQDLFYDPACELPASRHASIPLPGAKPSLGRFPSIDAGSGGQSGSRGRALAARISHAGPAAAYTVRPTEMPFADPQRRHLLRHYLQFTAPMLSIFEIDRPDSDAMFLERSDKRPRRNFWTFFVPSIAMLSPPLAYAICALASLQYEKQTDQVSGKSSEYYHEAIARLSNAIGLAHRRSEVSLLIATLLLGYYEVMSAEHKNW